MVLGLDTGFANVGWAVARMTCNTLVPGNNILVPIAMGIHRSESSAKKLKIKVGDDDFARSQAIAKMLYDLMRTYSPVVVCCEAFSPMRNAGTVAKVGRCFGVLAAITQHFDVPCLHATPMELKKVVTGTKDASKEAVMAALDQRYQGAPKALLEKSKIPQGQREHPYDALGSIVASWDAEPMRMARRLR